jgi:glycosyltransferase involved in cell wall biosynthesis
MASPVTKLPSLSVFIPCFNEAENLDPLIVSLLTFLPEISRQFEVIIINDGSRDQTGVLADALSRKHPEVKVVHHPRNLGYGMALRSGFKSARYEWTFFTDGDRQFNVRELLKFIPFTTNCRVIIGYREKRAEGQVRALPARFFKLYIDLLFRVHVKDIDCAFKLIRTDLIQRINFISTGATINAELLYRLKKMHEPFKQIPVTHYLRLHGTPTGNHPQVILRAGIESIKIYLNLKFGWKFT